MSVMTKILVTGGAGYIGSQTCNQLASAGLEPIVYDNLSTGYEEFVKWGPLVVGELADTELLRETITRYQPDAVLHFAAASLVHESVTNPGYYYRNNVEGTLSLLEAMRDTGLMNIVVSSSCAIYGIPDRLPISEECPLNPINPYGTSKLFMEQMCRDFGSAHGLRWVAMRYFNACGADPNSGVGERHIPESHLIPRLLMALDDELDRIRIFGDDYPTADGTCERDYIHVCDLAEAHIAGLRYLKNGGESKSMNLGTGTAWSVRQIVEAAQQAASRSVECEVVDRRPGDPPCLVADASLAQRALNWTPKHSVLPEIMESAWEWHLRDKKIRNERSDASLTHDPR